MIHVYKLGGNWKRHGVSYHIIAINEDHLPKYLNDGWVTDFDELSERNSQSFLRGKIKELGGTPAARAKIETLQKQLEDLENEPTIERSDG